VSSVVVHSIGILTWIALGVVALVLVLSVTTLLLSVRRRRTDRRRQAARRYVRGEFFERRRRDDPRWEQWVAELSALERAELERLTEQYLRAVSGAEREPYLELAGVLGMGEQAIAALSSGDTVSQLRALARLTLLEYPVSEGRLLETGFGTQRTREAAARLLYERRGEFRRPAALATAILVWGGTRPMTAWGLKTLHQHNDGDPRPLLLQGAWSVDRWSEPTLEQTCTVLGECQTTLGPSWFEWVFPLLEHENPRVRAAAIGAFTPTGWRDDFRERIPFRTLLADEPRVRRATYRVLAYWGDESARELLEWAVIDEDDARAQLLAVRALASLEVEVDPDEDQPAWPDSSWNWVRAELVAAEHRRLPSRTGVVGT